MLGPALLIAGPAYYDLVDKYAPTLPGEGWYDFWTGVQIAKAPSLSELAAKSQASPDGSTLKSAKMKTAMKAIEESNITPKLDQLPVFVRSGSIIPMQALVQSTDETPKGPLELRVYPGQHCAGSVYSDDGHSFAYTHDDYLRIAYSCQVTDAGVSVHMGPRQGHHTPWWTQVEVVVYGWTSAQAVATLSGATQPLKTRVDAATQTVRVLLPENAAERDLVLKAR
jgi:alpha-glucosidase